MKVGIVGAGNVGSALGKALAEKGHSIVFGVRDPYNDKTRKLLAGINGDARAGSVREAVNHGEVVIIAVHWPAVETVIPKGGSWNGKILVDATNRFAPPMSDSAGSAAEDIARMAIGARIIKAFNTIGAEHMSNPDFNGQKASMFICGDDPDAKAKVASLAADIGFDPIDAGGLNNARLLESLTVLWVSLARGSLGRNIAFKILRKE